MTSPRRLLIIALASVLALASGAGAAPLQSQPAALAGVIAGTAFTYQGRLNDGGSPATGAYDFEFNLYDADSGGALVAGPLAVDDVAVTDGYFAVSLDFGAGAFTGEARWLEIAVRPGASGGAYTPLVPRQALTAAPYALYATGNWGLNGNAGTTASEVLGTTDPVTLTLVVGGVVAYRLLPTGGQPNVLGGAVSNAVLSGTVAATVSGGYSNTVGAYAVVGGGAENSATGIVSSIGGGFFNEANTGYTTIGGGQGNLVSGGFSSVLGGADNTASGTFAAVGGGLSNTASGNRSAIAGGDGNLAAGSWGVIAAGFANTITASADYAAIGGGARNQVHGDHTTISGGQGNTASGDSATVGGGENNGASGDWGWVGGGFSNTAIGHYAAVGGGFDNRAFGQYATVGGGITNTASSTWSTVGGGIRNTASDNYTVVSGGFQNTADGLYAAVAGGDNNQALDNWAFVGGGDLNTASGDNATVAGGDQNDATGNHAFVGGGAGNTSSGNLATVGGGDANTAGAQRATIAGGSFNDAMGSYSTITGGFSNTVLGGYGSVLGGANNVVSGFYGVVSGGDENVATSDWAAVGGGYANLASGAYATAGGGFGNSVTGERAVVAGGSGNFAGGAYSAIPGGFNNVATLTGTLAAGVFASASHLNTFVWSDGASFASTANNQFLVRATGGVGLGTNAPDGQLHVASSGNNNFPQVYISQTVTGNEYARLRLHQNGKTYWDLAAGGTNNVFNIYNDGTNHLAILPDDATNLLFMSNGARLTQGGAWTNASDRDLKTAFAPVDPARILDALAGLPLYTWQYRAEPDSVRHLGPTAQDFRAAFGLGADDVSITTLDADGVALAAIQALHAENESLQARLAALEARAPNVPLPWLLFAGLGLLNVGYVVGRRRNRA